MITCKRCGYKWYPRCECPHQCPRCGSEHYDKPRREIEPGRRPSQRNEQGIIERVK
jgi:predicted nucleic-acid-binding Zn-ribbon protein